MITCDEIIKETRTIPTSFIGKRQSLQHKVSIYDLLSFLLITIALLIAVSIYCYQHLSKTKTFITISCH